MDYHRKELLLDSLSRRRNNNISPEPNSYLSNSFEVAEIAKFTASEELTYEASLMHYRDMNNVIDTAFSDGEMKGKAEGRAEGKAEGKYEEKRIIAINALKMNIDNKVIEQITGLSQLEIEDIRNEIKE